jgi:hypothetical protein
VQQTLYRAARSAGDYQSQQRKRRASAKQQGTLARRVKKHIEQLQKMQNRSVGLIAALEEALGPNHPLPAQMKTNAQTLRTDITELERRREEYLKSAGGIEGRPSDAWMLGYVREMARGWTLLTTLPITPRGYFVRFLQDGLKLLRPDKELTDLESLIKTAIKRFRLKSTKPLQPGNDLALSQVEKLTPDCA